MTTMIGYLRRIAMNLCTFVIQVYVPLLTVWVSRTLRIYRTSINQTTLPV